MNRALLTLMLAPAAFGMRYAPSNDGITFASPIDLLHPPANHLSACTSPSNTVAVGFDLYDGGGFQILCADAGEIGFWTTPSPAGLVGDGSGPSHRFLCPSGTALAGLEPPTATRAFPLPLCGTLDPALFIGQVHWEFLFTAENQLVASPTQAAPPGVVACPVTKFVQTLRPGFTITCNEVVTGAIGLDGPHVDLAVKTVNQSAILGNSASQTFHAELFNLGSAEVPSTNIRLELRFNGSAWQVVPLTSGVTCTDIVTRSGTVDGIVVGERCTVPRSVLPRNRLSLSFRLEPLGPDSRRPPSRRPEPIVTISASILDEHQDGADANTSNDTAAFPVFIR